MQPIVLRKRVMLAHHLAARVRRLGPSITGGLLLASCSTLLGIEDPVPRDCRGDACAGDTNGGAPPATGGKAMSSGGAQNQSSDGGASGEAVTPKVEGGEGGVSHSTEIGGAGHEMGGAPPQIECVDNEKRCNVYQRQICVSGHWMDDGPECPLACVDGACQTPASCAPSATPSPCVGGVSCCETIWIDGGTYLMGHGDEDDEISYERTVSGFYLDRFEVTVGRFRAFYANYVLPNEGEGAHPRVPGTGWQAAWEDVSHNWVDGRKAVPANKDDLLLQLTDDCDGSSWAADDPELPITCVNWYVAFAFCAYDGGRLPTEAEWNYAAAFGNAQRPYPWSASTADRSIDTTKATFNNYPMPSPDFPRSVGASPAGRGGFFRFEGRGHDDLAGNVAEWTLDQWLDSPPATCTGNCVAPWEEGVEDRVVRGGAYGSPYSELLVGSRAWAAASSIASYWGFRCARDMDTSANP